MTRLLPSILSIMVIVLLAVTSPRAQSLSTLSGDWVLASETITKADGAPEFVSFFKFGSRLKIQQDEKLFTVAAWTLPIDGDVVTDSMGVRWRAKRQGGTIVVTAARGDVAAGTSSTLSMMFRLGVDGRLSVDIAADPVVQVRVVKSVYSLAPKPVVPRTLPAFAGHWIVDEAASELNGSTAWFGNEAVVSLDTKGLTVSGAGGPLSGKVLYPTDGEHSRVTGPGGMAMSQAEWRGSQLLATNWSCRIATDRASQREVLRATERRLTVSLAADGALVVEVSTTPMPERIGFATRSVYRKSKD